MLISRGHVPTLLYKYITKYIHTLSTSGATKILLPIITKIMEEKVIETIRYKVG